MKKSILCISFMCCASFIIKTLLLMFCASMLYSCAQSVTGKDEVLPDEELPKTYGVVETAKFTLPAGCHWVYAIPADRSTGLRIINSQEELEKSVSCGEAPARVDFTKNSLLLAYGDTLRKVQELTYKLVQLSENEYRLEVTIRSSMNEAWPGGWTLAAVAPKIPQNTTILLKEEEIPDNTEKPVEENPYRADITGYWKLQNSITGEDTLLLTDPVVYEFRADGKLVISGNTSQGDVLAAGEHTYIYKQPNKCSTCSFVPNMQIDAIDQLYGLPLIDEGKMTIGGGNVKWNRTLVRVDEIYNSNNENTSDMGNDYFLKEPCTWQVSKLKTNTVYVIRSIEDFHTFVSCGEDIVPDIDFDKYSLLFAYGCASYEIHIRTYKVTQLSHDKFQLEVEIEYGMAAVPGTWRVASIIPQVNYDATTDLIVNVIHPVN